MEPKGIGEKAKEIFDRYVRNKYRPNYETIPTTQGFVVGGADIAILAMAVGRQTEEYSIARESLPLAETKREQVASRPQEISSFALQRHNNKFYSLYNKLYRQYGPIVSELKSGLKKVYKTSIEKLFSRLRSIYQGDNGSGGVKKLPYNPFRKNLGGNVVPFPVHYPNVPVEYPVVKGPLYKKGNPNSSREIGLERLVA